MAGFSEWSNQKKKEQGASGAQPVGTGAAQSASSGAKSFTEWSNQKHGITTPQSYRSTNTGFERSGLTRDEYDSSVRQNYAARAAASSTADKVSEGEFNRSSAMQKQWGSYQNYLNDRKTTAGGYYSQPQDIGVNMDRLYNTYTVYEADLKPKAQALETANKQLEDLQGKLTAQGQKLEQLYSFAQSDSSGIAGAIFEQAKQEYNGLLTELDTAATAADSAWAAYEPAYNKYVEAATAFDSYRTEQQTAYDSWKGAIRSAEEIQEDKDVAQAQIDALKQQQKALNNEATQLMNRVSGRGGGTQQLMDWSAQASEKRNAANALQSQIDELQGGIDLLGEEADWAEYFKWADLAGNEDFTTGSAYVSTANGKKRSNWDIVVNNYDDSLSGYDDPLYEYINGNSEAGAYITNQAGELYGGDSNPLGALFGMSTENKSESQQMTQDEVAIFNYLYSTQGKEAAHAYYEYLTGDLNYRQRKEEEQYWADYAKESPVGSSVFSVLTAPMKGLSYIAQAADYLGSGTIDQNAAYNRFSYANSAIRNQVSQTIEESGNWGKVGSFAYNTGMSMADFLFNTAVSGGFSGGGSISSAMALGIMGSGAAADTVIISKDRGLSDGESFALGTIAGAAEILTEKFSLDALLKGKWEQSAIKYILKNALTEGSEEVGSDVINLMADVLIAKDKSQWQQTIDAYMEQGKTEGEAFGLALAEQAAQMGLDFLGGALSGGVMSGTGAGIGTLNQNAAYQKTGATIRKFGDETLQAIIDTGLQADENTKAHQLAAEMQQKIQSGKKVTDAEIGKLFSAAGQAVNTAQQTETQKTEAQPEGEMSNGIVLPTVEEVETQKAQPQTATVQEQEANDAQQPGMLPTAEQAEKQQRMANAKTELERSAIEYGVDEETMGRVQRIAEIVGRSVAFYSTSPNENGYYEPKSGTLYLNVRSGNPVAQIISHELTHSLEKTGSYGAFQNLVLNRIQQTGGNIEQIRKDKKALYERNGRPLESNAAADKEIVAEYVEKNLLTDEASIRAVVQQNRTLGQRILNWLNDMLAKMGNANAQERAFLTQARNIYSDALKQSQSSFTNETERATRSTEQSAADSTENDEYLLSLRSQLANGEITEEEFDKLFEDYYDGGTETEFSFGGQNANGADLDALKKAQEMELKGVSPDIIFKTTGWYTGADGKWRFEMDDSGMQYSRWGDMQRTDREEYQRFRELEMKFIDGSITLDEQNELRQLIDEEHGSGRAEEQGTQELGDFIKHDELFHNYPQLRKARMNFADLEGNTMGAYNPDTNRITLDTSLRGAAEDVLVHEIQHAIQKAEGFARGSSPESWEENKGSTQRVAVVERIQGEINALEEMLNSESEEESAGPIEADIEQLRETLGRLNYHLYENTAGEIEARDAADRRRMTPEQRRQTLPNTGDENTVFAEDEGDSYSISEIKGQNEDYGMGVVLDTNLFNGVKPRNWGAVLGKYVYQNMAGREMTMYDEDGNAETVYLARENDRVKKDGAKNSRKVIDKLARSTGDNIRTLATVHLSEALATSGNETSTEEHSHQWMDENGWIYRTTYLRDKKGNIYEATLNIADGRDRKILYDINNIRLIDKKRTADGVVSSTENGRDAHINSSSSETGAAKALNPSPGTDRSAAKVSTDSIRGESENVNGLPVKRQFSLSEPVEQTETLLALHNMDEEKLRRTLNLGSWPSPSIAIVEAEQGHANYGEYSAVFPRGVIDPEADGRNKVYGSDAWTPTWRNAQVEYEVDYDTKKAIENKVMDLSRQVAGGIFSKSSIISSRVNDTSDMDADKLAERLAGDDTVRAAYLAETGGTLEPVMKSKEWDSFGNGVLQQFIDEVGVQELARAEAEIEADNGSETVKQYTQLIQSLAREDYRKSHQSFLNKKPEFAEKRLDAYIENNASGYFRIEDFIKHAWQMYEDGGATKGDIDRGATEDALRAAVNDEDVETWIRGQMDDLMGEPGIYNGKERYSSSGNSRSFASLHWKYNAENIVKAMNLAEDRGEGYWGASAEGMMAMATPQYGSVDEMHADETRLRTESEEDRKARFESIDNQIRDIISAVRAETKAHASSSYEENDIIGSVLMQAATGDKSASGIQKAFKREGYDISKTIAQAAADMYAEAASIPTGYFEAKPQRVVDFDEALAVVTPTDAPAELVAAMRNAGMNVVEYEAGNEEDRLSVVNSIEGAKFSISEEEDGYNETAVLEESTIDKYLKDYAAQTSPNYAQAYIAYISPEDFIRLTTSKGGRDLIERQSHTLDMEEFKDSTRHQPLQMRIDHETGEVEGHEGRHRAAALSKAGIQRVPVLLFDSGNKYSKAAMDILTLTGQDFGNTRSNATVDVFDVQPFSYANRETILKTYGRQPAQERIAENYGRKTVRYSIGEDELQQVERMIDDGSGESIFKTGLLRSNEDLLTRVVRDRSKTQTENFKNWFGDSKAVNVSGEPLLLFHGAGARFTAFNSDAAPIWFSANPVYAREYASSQKVAERVLPASKIYAGNEERIIPAYIRAESPANIGDTDAYLKPNIQNLSRTLGIRPSEIEKVWRDTGTNDRIWQTVNTREFKELLMKNGYDSIQAIESGTKTWAVFDSAQAKSAIANSGEYGSENRDIRYSLNEDDENVQEAKLPGGVDVETSARDTMPVKAQQYLKRTERALLEKVSKALSVPAFAKREYLQDIVREISDEYLSEGRVSQETIERLFDTAYDEGVMVDSEFYDTYKEIKDHLRTQAVTISEQDKSDIADYNDFRKSAFGTLRIVNEGGLPVDVAYQELQGMAQELFPEDITHPADQLMRMFEVARSIEKSEKSLQEYYGRDAEDFRSWAKNDFDAAVNDTIGELKTVKRYADERAADAESGALETQEDVEKAYKNLKEARRTYEKAAAKNLLTDHDNVRLGRLLKGELELQHLDPEKDNVRGITAVYEAKAEYERLMKLIKDWNTKRRAELRAKADKYLSTANDWSDKKAGILYSRETMERNVLDIVKDKKLAQEIIDEYFKPVHDAQAKSTKMKNNFRERVRELNLSTKETKAMQQRGQVSEAHAVQLLGEAMDNIRMLENSRGRMEQRDGKTLSDWRGIVQDLRAQNQQLDWKKIENAVEEFRKIYDELFKLMNESRLRNGYEPVNYRNGYFPHFQPGNGDGVMALFGKALGISTEVTALPTTINGLTHTFKPGIQWLGNAQERLGFNTAYDAVEGFDKYIEGVADVINQTDNIQRLRALATQTRYRTGDEGIRKQVDAVYADTSLSEQDKQNRIDKIFESGRYALSNFVVELEEYTNLLANKKSRADRNMEQALGRNMYNIVKALESRVAANMVAVNPASWLTNFIPLTQGNAMLDRGQLLKGMWQTLQAYKTDDGIVDASTFLINRRGSDPLVKTWAQKASGTMSSPMEFIDRFTADSLVRARYNQNLKKGLSESAAMSEADSWVAGVMADRSKGSMPTLFNRNNPLTKVFTQFQLEVNNQLSYVFKDMPRGLREKGLGALALALIKFCLGAWLYDEVYEYFIGRRPALDPIGILNDTVGDITGYELPNLVELGVGAITGDMPSFEVEKKGAGDAGKNLTENLLEELPFVSALNVLGINLDAGRLPVSSAIPDLSAMWDAATNTEWDSKKRLKEFGDEILKLATYLALPFGGGQLKKIYQGLEAVIKGGSYTVDSEGNDILQYPVYNDNAWDFAKNATQAVLFGKTSLSTGQDWIESDFKSFGAKETAAYQAMTEAGVPGEDAYNLLKELRGAEKTDTESEAEQERKLLRESDISGDGKSVVYYGLMASPSERELMDAMADVDADMGEVTSVLMKVKDAEDLRGAEKGNEKRNALMNSALTDTEKEETYRYLFGDKQDDGSYTTSRDDDIMAFEQAGMDFDTFLKVQNEYATVGEDYGSASEKATEFSRWVNAQDFTAEEAATVKNSFTNQMPAKAARYDGFVEAGIADDDAYALANKINELEPLDGEDSVSDMQRYQAVAESGLSDEDQLLAMSKLMGDAEFAKLQTGYRYGVTPSSWVKFKQLQPLYDTDGNGSFKQDEVTAALSALVTSSEVRAALWQMANKSWKPKNNPFSSSVGQNVYDALNAETDVSGIVLPTASNGGIVLPMY